MKPALRGGHCSHLTCATGIAYSELRRCSVHPMGRNSLYGQLKWAWQDSIGVETRYGAPAGRLRIPRALRLERASPRPQSLRPCLDEDFAVALDFDVQAVSLEQQQIHERLRIHNPRWLFQLLTNESDRLMRIRSVRDHRQRLKVLGQSIIQE